MLTAVSRGESSDEEDEAMYRRPIDGAMGRNVAGSLEPAPIHPARPGSSALPCTEARSDGVGATDALGSHCWRLSPSEDLANSRRKDPARAWR